MKKIGLLGIVLAVLIFVTGCDQQVKQENTQLKNQISSLIEENTNLKNIVANLQKENENLKGKATSPDNSIIGEKTFGVTKEEFVKNCNVGLSKLGLSFKKDAQYEGTVLKGFSIITNISGQKGPIAMMDLNGPKDQVNKIDLLVFKVNGRPNAEFLEIMNLVLIQTMQLDDVKVFDEKWRKNFDQGHEKFSFAVGNDNIECTTFHKGDVFYGVRLFITPL